MNKSKNIKVSVLLVTYNQKDYIRQALDSILMQRCNFKYELLIGEDCSTDGTREICMEYAAKFPEIIDLHLNEGNKGFLNNYFDLFLLARGKYMADCGGDDFWLDENKLQTQVDYLEKHPKTGMIAGNWKTLDAQTNVLNDAISLHENEFYTHSHFGTQAVAEYINSKEIPKVLLSSTCFRTDWAMEAYINSPYLFVGEDSTCEDLPITLSLLMKGPIHFDSTYWAVYRIQENSVSHSENRHAWVKTFAFKTFRQTLNIAKQYGIGPNGLSTYLSKNAKELALIAFIYSDRDLIRDLIAYLQKQGWPIPLKVRMLQIGMQSKKINRFLNWLYQKSFIKSKIVPAR